MTRNFVELTCPRCGGELEDKGGGLFVCVHCERRWEKEIIDDYEKIFEKFDVALREQRMKDLAALARRRYEETRKKDVSNIELERICEKILDFNPDDFYAQFYLATCKEDYSLEEFLYAMDIKKHYYDVEQMLEYLIRGLQARWINAVSTLIENVYKSRDIGKYNIYRTKFEKMASDVEEGMFEPTLPRDIFIAYSGRDMEKVNELLHILEDDNGLSCFVSARNMRHGGGAVENYRIVIQTAMRHCKAVLLVSSANARSLKCEAMQELIYIKENLPNMWRIELLTEDYRGVRTEYVFKDFFEGLEYCTSAEEVANRYFDKREAEMRTLAKKEDKEALERQAEEEKRRIDEKVQLKIEQLKLQIELETKRKLEAEFSAKLQAAEEARRKAEAEADGLRQRVETASSEANRKLRASEEARRKAEAEAAEAKRKSAMTVRKSSLFSDFKMEGDTLIKYKGKASRVTIPDTVKYIGPGAFSGCKGITVVTVPDSVTSIGANAFSSCENLMSINIPNSVTSIGADAFSYCGCLTSIIIPYSVTSMGRDVFYGLRNITVYCEAIIKRTGWHEDWDAYDRPTSSVRWRCPNIIWGYEG